MNLADVNEYQNKTDSDNNLQDPTHSENSIADGTKIPEESKKSGIANMHVRQ